MILLTFNAFTDWFAGNYDQLLITTSVIIISYVILKISSNRVNKYLEEGRINESTAKNIKNIIKISVLIVAISIITYQYQDSLGSLTNVWTVAGGTVIGFAAINTIGNLIAGLIVILSKPFVVGDRIEFRGRLADVIEIKLVYTLLEDIDGVRISIPNQKLLKEEIQDYGKDMILRRSIFITAGYEVEPKLVEEALIKATGNFKTILKFPEPRVDMYEFMDYAIKYRLIVFINNSKIIPRFDHQLRRAVYYSCRESNIDLMTPMVLMNNIIKEKEENAKIDNKNTKNEVKK